MLTIAVYVFIGWSVLISLGGFKGELQQGINVYSLEVGFRSKGRSEDLE